MAIQGLKTSAFLPLVLVVGLAAAGIFYGAGAHADEKAGSSGTVTKPPVRSAPTAATPKRLGVPSPKNLFIMIRTTLVALYQANVTNNYSVLRDLGAPSFQQANSVERLSAAFTDLRTRGGDIAPVVLALPTLSRPAAIDENGMLRLTGTFDTQPNELAFDLAFQAVDGLWRLDGIAVQFRTRVPAPAKATDDTAKKSQPEKPASGAKAKAKKTTKNQKAEPK
jgi:hypothetical protein